jgi:NAD(P)-dependent dehydrogenase (short-subunit alcohol dehydrogenase family)
MTKTILITGASSGIGRASATLFQQRGWNVVATMRKPEGDALGELPNVLLTRLDVTDESSIEAAAAAGIERFGPDDLSTLPTLALAYAKTGDTKRTA